MQIDHIAIRTSNRKAVVDMYKKLFGYIEVTTFPVVFDNNKENYATCTVLRPNVLDKSPEIFVSEGGSVVTEWVLQFGEGIHHIAWLVDSVSDTMREWAALGVKFSSEAPMVCPEDGLVQIFTLRDAQTGLVYELIERPHGAANFCSSSVRDLMLASAKEFNDTNVPKV